MDECRRELVLLLLERRGQAIDLGSPAVGWLRRIAPSGSRVGAGQCVAELEVLGLRHNLVVPPAVRGILLGDPAHAHSARHPVAYGDRVATISADEADGVAAAAGPSAAGPGASESLLFRARSSGRFYRRPAPQEAPFVEVGDVVKAGQTIGLLEVMKTFYRVSYGGPDLPEAAQITAIVANDEDDVEAGDVILHLGPVRPSGGGAGRDKA